MKILVVVTARGGSKRLPNKNLADLGGKPLVAWTIEVGLAAYGAGSLVVSTDDPQIRALTNSYEDILVIERPTELAQDSTPSLPVVAHAAREAKDFHGMDFDAVLLLQPTSPFRTVEDVRAAVAIMEHNDDALSVVSVVERSPDGLFEVMPNGQMRTIPEQLLYACNGAIYLIRSCHLASGGDFYGGGAYAYIMPIERSLDIDTHADIEAARIMLGSDGKPRLYTNKKATSPV
jgi:CMP-N,N'-diacetyllegionaminic acid synthase